MKFNSVLDVQTFLVEAKAFDKLNKVKSKDYVPTNEELGSFLKARSPLVKKLKNYRKSANSKAAWRQNRTKMMKGIKAFHKSVKGKRFHKRLGRFMATRIVRSKEKNEDAYDMLLLKQGYLKGLNAAKQHILVELEYFHQLQEQVEIEEFLIEYAFPLFKDVEEAILSDRDLSPDEQIFLFDLIEESAIKQAVSEKAGLEFAQIEKVWNAINIDLNGKGVDNCTDDYYPQLISCLKKNLGNA